MLKKNIINTYQLVKFDFKSRYAKTSLGQIWYLISPIIMLFIYTVIFSDFMSARLGISDQPYAYSIYLIPGLFAYSAFSNTLTLMMDVPFAKAGILKKINTPIYIFELSPLIIQFLIFIFSMFIGVLFLVTVKEISFNILFIIPMMILQTLFVFGLGLFLSVFAVFFRDIKEIIPIVLQLLFWATPIVYPAYIIEQKAKILLYINPFYYFVRPYQDIFLLGSVKLNDFIAPAILSATSLVVGIFFYKKLVGAVRDNL
ncbi:ABC transporter permease [Campylobacter sp. RM16190]|uniref:ABC transporter permease n=1 Tax=Campylobacter sp. RM16190 TaxID=1705727 RepID=UPI0014753DE2|nr:ABC transporter permease [Campylobacter sp. RM16190]